MESHHTNTPQEPKKGFWAKLFGGGKKSDQQTSTDPQPISPPPVPPVDTSVPPPIEPPVSSGSDRFAPPLPPSTPGINSQNVNAVDDALDALPDLPSQTIVPPPPPVTAWETPPTPPSDPMVTPTQVSTSLDPELHPSALHGEPSQKSFNMLPEPPLPPEPPVPPSDRPPLTPPTR